MHMNKSKATCTAMDNAKFIQKHGLRDTCQWSRGIHASLVKSGSIGELEVLLVALELVL